METIMSEEKKVTKYDHNYKNRSPMEELAELVSKNQYLKDALTIAVKTIAKFSKSGHAVSCSLDKLNDAKNNWDRSKHADVAIRQADKLNKDLWPFRKVISTLRYKEDMYSHLNKKHTLELGSTYGNFGMHHANNDKELSDAVIEAEKQWKEEDSNE
jgi:hypothetical protein